MSWFSLVIGQNASRQLATSSENSVASAQFLVALATSESQCRALQMQVLDFVNGFSHALEQVVEALESFHELLGRISWALERQSEMLERSR